MGGGAYISSCEALGALELHLQRSLDSLLQERPAGKKPFPSLLQMHLLISLPVPDFHYFFYPVFTVFTLMYVFVPYLYRPHTWRCTSGTEHLANTTHSARPQKHLLASPATTLPLRRYLELTQTGTCSYVKVQVPLWWATRECNLQKGLAA